MKTFSRLMAEIAQPNSEDELNFKEKHIIDPKDHPVAPESVFSGNVDKDDLDGMKRYRKNKRRADYQHPEDEAVYEGVSLKRDMPGQEDDDVDNDNDKDFTDSQYKYRRHAQIKNKIIDEMFVIPEEILATEKNAFHTAAANAHKAGKKHFAFGGKKYPVTMSKSAAKTFAGKGLSEKVTEPYAVGMAQAMKSTGDKPPLEKKTIRLAHKIAKGIEKNESIEEAVNSKKITADHDAGHSIDVIVQNHLNKKGDNKDEILKVIRDHRWKTRMKKEDMDPVGQEDDDINNDGKVNKSDKYLHNRRKAISTSIRTKIKEGFGSVTAAGGDYDEEESHQRYKKSNSSKSEGITLANGKGLKVYAGKTKKSQIQEEQIDEISSNLANRYADKASDSIRRNIRKSEGGFPLSNKDKQSDLKRSKGLDYADAKLGGYAKINANEEVKLDEASDPRKVRDELKSEGKHREAGEHAFKHNLGRSYGPHFGMRSSKNNAEMEYHKGYDYAQARASRAARMTNEEVELDELNKSTLSSYIKKASGNMAGNAAVAAAQASSSMRKSTPEVKRNIANRMKGISRASDKLANEEVEQIDELKKSTLGSYIRRAAYDTYHRGQDVEMHGNMHGKTDDYASKRRHSELMDKARRKASNRVTGIERATKQLQKESYDLTEAFSAGSIKLNDGSSVMLKAQDAKLLNNLMNDLRPENRKKMMKVAMTDKHGFNEILGFAREAL